MTLGNCMARGLGISTGVFWGFEVVGNGSLPRPWHERDQPCTQGSSVPGRQAARLSWQHTLETTPTEDIIVNLCTMTVRLLWLRLTQLEQDGDPLLHRTAMGPITRTKSS